MSKWTRGLLPVLMFGLVAGVACSTPSGPPPPDSDENSTSMVGKPAPDFTLPAAGGKDVSLGDYRGRKAVLLYFSMGPG
ncbi:MAG: redoxin domain-containing protein [Actinomycetota bacterium]